MAIISLKSPLTPLSIVSFYNKQLFYTFLGFSFFFCNLVVILVQRVVVFVLVRREVVSSRYNVCLLSSWCGIYLCEGDSNEQSISDQLQEIKSMVVNMLQN